VSSHRLKLGHLEKGLKARIIRVGGEGIPVELTERLLEMGFLEGAEVEVIHEAPFGKDPVAVRVRGALIALRRNEADAIEIVTIGVAPEVVRK
jgi:ferrous iron transport protein A